MTSRTGGGAPIEALLTRDRLAVVAVTGGDRASYLEDVTSQHVVDRDPGTVTAALQLDAHGAPEAVFDVVVLPERLLLLVPPELRDHAVEVLGGRTFLLDADFEALEHGMLSLLGPDARDVAAQIGVRAHPGHAEVGEIPGQPQGRRIVVGRRAAVDVIAPSAHLDTLRDAAVDLGARPAEPADLDAWRVDAGVPAWGREITAPHLPEELGLLPTHVHLAKGCYPGQEAVARMWNLGRPRRRLARVRISPPVAAGWEGGERRRRIAVTTVGRADGDAVDALAFVPPGLGHDEVVEIDGHEIMVRELIGADSPVPGRDPDVQRRRDRAS